VIPLALLLPAIAGIMLVEMIFLGLQPGGRRARLLPNVAAGFCIVLAWNASAQGWPVPVILLALTAALAAHAADLYRRW
jgi:hypothetical protein